MHSPHRTALLGHLGAAAQPASSRALGTVRRVQPHHVACSSLVPHEPQATAFTLSGKSQVGQGNSAGPQAPRVTPSPGSGGHSTGATLKGLCSGDPWPGLQGVQGTAFGAVPQTCTESTYRSAWGMGQRGDAETARPAAPRHRHPMEAPTLSAGCPQPAGLTCPSPRSLLTRKEDLGGLGHQQSSLPPVPPKSGFEALPCPSPLPRWGSPTPSISHSFVQQTSVTISTVPGPPRRS